MKKMKLGFIMVLLVMPMLLATTASAKPKWYRPENATLYPWLSVYEKPRFVPWFDHHPPHRATDPLLVVESLDPTLWGEDPPEDGWSLDYELGGWVTFMCESQEGFDYSIDVKGLDPKTKYDVSAFDVLSLTMVDLGDISTDKDGEGEIEGVIGLDPGFYVYAISVNLDGTPILQTLSPNTFYDPDLPDWIIPLPEPWGPTLLEDMLWILGDAADFEVFP